MERVYIASSDEYDYFGDDWEEMAELELENQVYEKGFNALNRMVNSHNLETQEQLADDYDTLLKCLDQLYSARRYIKRCVNQRYGEKPFRKELKEWLEREYEDFIDYENC